MSNLYLAYSKNKQILKKSSSGGLFYFFAKHYIEYLHGVVFGVAFEKGHFIRKKVDSMNNLEPLLGSKYVKVSLGNCFKECEDELVNGRFVLFSGLPCEVSLLKLYLLNKKINIDNLLLIDVICHGAPDIKYWNSYITEKFPLENIESVNFRYKKPSWNEYSIKINTNKGQYVSEIKQDEYMRLFLKNYILSKPCYSCDYRGKNRSSDLTLGDFWKSDQFYAEFQNINGTSMLRINNESKKESILSIIKNNVYLKNVDESLLGICNESFYLSPNYPLDYDKVVCEITSNGFLKTGKKFIIPKRKKIHCFLSKLKSSVKNLDFVKGKTLAKNSIGIISDFGYKNYGNKLQNFALRNCIEKSGNKPVNFVLDPGKCNILAPLYTLRYKPTKREKAIMKASKATGEKNIYFAYTKKRKTLVPLFKSLIIGSDQVWNFTYHTKEEMLFNTGGFCTSHNTKISSYAASLGVDNISEFYKPLFNNNLSKLSKITVREKNAQLLLNDMGIQTQLACDPTLLLSEKDWNAAISKYSAMKIPTNNYVFVYCLKDSYKYNFDGKETVNILDKQSKFFNSNQFDFINLIKNADLVFTNSYHAFIFSIIFRKKIKLICRESMFSRFDYLFEQLGIRYKEDEIIDFSKIDYSKLNNFINSSKEYLKTLF